MTEPNRPLQRILVALDTSPYGSLALQLAAQIATELHGSLEGLFYEDAELLKLCGLPFVREMSYTAAGRGLNRDVMQRALRARGAEIQQQFKQLADQLKLQCQLRTVRQRAVPHALEAARDADLLLLGLESRQPRGSIRLQSQKQARMRGVSVLYDGSPASQRALAIGSLAALSGRPLIILPVAGEVAAGRQLGQQALTQLNAPAQVAEPPLRTTTDVLEVVRRRAGDVLISPWEIFVDAPAVREQLINELDCLVLLVR